MLQGVLFDMDGLMFDTECIGRDGWHKAAEILHIDLPEGIIAAMRGTGTDRCREIFNAAIPGSLYDTAHDLRLRYADEVIAANGVPVKPGLRELLRRLKASDIPAVLATSTRREKALAYLQQTDVERYFTAAVFGPESSVSVTLRSASPIMRRQAGSGLTRLHRLGWGGTMVCPACRASL